MSKANRKNRQRKLGIKANNMRRFCIALLLFFCAAKLVAHSNFIAHCEDMMAVFGFENNTKIFSRSKDTKTNTSWMKVISSDMIDNTSFHHELERRHPNFKISSPNFHRLLFHWGYNAKPWSSQLESYIRKYCKANKLNEEQTIRKFREEIEDEQARRNRKMNELTENVFGFGHGGKDARYAQFFTAMAYNIHLLGDQESEDNHLFDGVASVNYLMGQFVLTLRMLDNRLSKPLEKGITAIKKKYEDPHKKADALMVYLKQNVPAFVKQAQGGSIARRLAKRGIKLK